MGEDEAFMKACLVVAFIEAIVIAMVTLLAIIL